MKIALDARVINSGTGRYIERLLHYLEELDKENDYLILVRRKDLQYYRPVNQRFKIVEADFADYSFAEQLGLKSLLDFLQPDLVHFCMPQQPVLYRGRHVTTVHDVTLLNTYNSDKNFLAYHAKQLVGRAVFWRVGHSSRFILCPSNYTRNAFRRFARILADKVVVTYEGSELDRAVKPQPYNLASDPAASLPASQPSQPHKAPSQTAPFLLYVGKHSDYKNIRRLVRAHQKLRQSRPQLQLVLVGRLSGKDGVPTARNKAWVEEQGFDGVIFTDFVPDAQLAWLYQHCAAYVFPSLMEGFGLPGLEAMAQGAPVVSSNATCLPEIYQDGAQYFDPLSVDDVAQAIAAVIDNPARQAELRRTGKKVAAQYSWRRMAEQTLAVYRRALA